MRDWLYVTMGPTMPSPVCAKASLSMMCLCLHPPLSMQSRRLALQLCDVLFSRSKCFRRLLTAHFSLFVELTVGHKPEKPLPPPPSAAIELRQNALECIEKWREQWGLQYPQVHPLIEMKHIQQGLTTTAIQIFSKFLLYLSWDSSHQGYVTANQQSCHQHMRQATA